MNEQRDDDAPQGASGPKLPTYRAPPFKAFAWAAIVVVSFSVVLNIVFQQAEQDPVARMMRMDGPPIESAPAAADVFRLIADYVARPGRVVYPEPGQARDTSDADAVLRRILSLHERGESEAALAALAEFRHRYPDHPVSVGLAERGW